MTPDDIRATVLRALGAVAPEADLDHLKPDVSFRDQLDIDSMDFLNIVVAINERTGIEIPERDYPKLSTLNDAVGYLAHAQKQAAGA